MRPITALTKEELNSKRVLIRVGFDVPIKDGVVENDFRIREALPTIEYATNAGARVIIISHIGREPEATLLPVHKALSAYIPTGWCPSLRGSDVDHALEALLPGHALLLENLRSNEGEASNDDDFAKTLASYADLYVNEAFSVAHRSHASIVGIPKYIPSYAGIGLAREVEELSKAFTPTRPSVFVIGGAKFDTKLPLIKKFKNLYDKVYVCGALAHDLMTARGISIGASLSSDIPLDDREVIDAENVMLPRDVRIDTLGRGARIAPLGKVGPADSIMDAGPETIEEMLAAISKGGTLLWNGPLGWYERGFTDGTEAFAAGVARSSVTSIVGGGDTVASIEKLGLNKRFTHVSTGGGAMLEFLENGTLPGIEALKSA